MILGFLKTYTTQDYIKIHLKFSFKIFTVKKIKNFNLPKFGLFFYVYGVLFIMLSIKLIALPFGELKC
jgi:hypothetical protein